MSGAYGKTKKASGETSFIWSGIKDSNLRPRGPKPRALANCANPRFSAMQLYAALTDTASKWEFLKKG